MYEAAASNSKQLRQEEMRDLMVEEAAAGHGVPHQYMQAATFPVGQGLPQAQMNTGQAFHQQWAAQAAGSVAQQQAQNMAAQFGVQQAAAMHAAQLPQPQLPQPSVYGGVGSSRAKAIIKYRALYPCHRNKSWQAKWYSVGMVDKA